MACLIEHSVLETLFEQGAVGNKRLKKVEMEFAKRPIASWWKGVLGALR